MSDELVHSLISADDLEDLYRRILRWRCAHGAELSPVLCGIEP